MIVLIAGVVLILTSHSLAGQILGWIGLAIGVYELEKRKS